MSSTNRGTERRTDDAYYTPAWAVHRLLEVISLPGDRWLEPCAGDGAIIRAVSTVRDVNWTAVELREECREPLRACGIEPLIEDYLARPCPKHATILTNPPFALAQQFLEKALSEASCVAMLLRLNYLGSEKRATFLRMYPPDVYVLPNRPSFTGGSTDSCEYAWFVWWPELTTRRQGKIAVLKPTPASERRTGSE